MSEAAGVIDEETFRRIAAAVKRIEAMLPHRRIAGFDSRLGGDGDDGLWLQVTGATRDGDNWRWAYAAKPATPPAAAFGSWSLGDEVVAYNAIEHANDDDDQGVQSGIDLSVAGVTGIEPVHAGAIVRAWPHVFPGDSETPAAEVWIFSYPNGPAIDCGEEEEA